ncbi:MerR family transcriptional regulator [Alkalicoccobacillus porphyridii]|uniref:MerR family transcriptional regulator n=1 Tax=Alkalicoccobacillus porphyridii TaxID=2597270 RepID=A0A553ZZK3_9BACI|nr:MerR family transcriptional regulator [Alkalicoccobacillus porphyridii]TSB46880.1 MerR family transcriptional regulator [Alkalicoccobacillus porphyridii]
MTTSDGKYNIKALSIKLGIQPGTLRAWERRYKVIQPSRNAAGHRLYSEQQVHILNWLIDKINQGFTIGQAVDLMEAEWQSHEESKYKQKADFITQLADEIQAALLSFNEHEATQLLNKAFSIYSIEKVANDILGPVFKHVHLEANEPSISSASKYMVKSFINTKIKHICSNLPVDSRLPKAVTAPFHKGELASIQCLLFTLFLRQRGFEVIYLGEGVSNLDVEIVLREVSPGLSFYFCQEDGCEEQVQLFQQHMKKQFPNMYIAFGGNVDLTMCDCDCFLIGTQLSEWEQWLNQWFKSR